MREACIILPIADNEGNGLDNVHSELKRDLCAWFGGCTVTKGDGAWLNSQGKLYQEPVAIYTVAMEPSEANRFKLWDLARRLATDARQQAIYVRYADGSVDFVTAPVKAVIGA